MDEKKAKKPMQQKKGKAGRKAINPEGQIGLSRKEMGEIFEKSYEEHKKLHDEEIKKALSWGPLQIPPAGITPEAMKELLDAMLRVQSAALLDVLWAINERILGELEKTKPRAHFKV